MGSPVYYDWEGDGPFNHATICVGSNLINNEWVPVVNSHNYDYYEVPWDYGGSKCKYLTVQIDSTNDDYGNSIGYAGHSFRRLPQSMYGKINYAGDLDFISYTPYHTTTYVIETSGITDTYGQIYSSSGTLLQSDDDSGNGYDFLIKRSLTAGQTYYIKVKHYASGTGSYSLLINYDDGIITSSDFDGK